MDTLADKTYWNYYFPGIKEQKAVVTPKSVCRASLTRGSSTTCAESKTGGN